MGQRIQNDQIVLDQPKTHIRSTTRQKLDKVWSLIDDHFDYPGKVLFENVSGVDTVIRITESPLQHLQGTTSDSLINADYEAIGSVGNLFQSYPVSRLDLTTGNVSGSVDLGTPPTTTSGYWRWLLITARADTGIYQLNWGSQVSGMPAYGTSMAAKPKNQTELCSIRLQNNGTAGTWNYLRPAITDIFNHTRGSGGGGSGDASSYWEDMKRMLEDLPYQFLEGNIFSIDGSTKTDTTSSTTTYNLAEAAVDFSTSGSIWYSKNMYGSEFLSTLSDPSDIFIRLAYDESLVDTNPLVEVSRCSGAGFYETVTMSQIGSTNVLEGQFFYSAAVTGINLEQFNVSNADSASGLTAAGSYQRFSQEIVTSQYEFVDTIIVYVNKTGTPTGNLTVSLVKDSSGSPDTSVSRLVLQTITQSITTMTSGNNTITLSTNGVIAGGTKYHLVFETDDAYKSTYVALTNQLAVRMDSSSPTIANAKQYNGSTWATVTGAAIPYTLQGRIMGLIVRVTGRTAGARLRGVGVCVGNEQSGGGVYTKFLQKYSVDSTANTTTFLVDKYYPDPDLLKVYCVETGQVFRFGAFTLSGTTGGVNVTFPSGTFYSLPATTYTIIIEQMDGTSFDNSDANGMLLTSNHLGSSNTSLDRSVAGQGLFLRRPDGTLREIAIDNSDNIVVFSV